MAKVLVIGDTILDKYFYGNVSRISPEAPVPILQCDYCEEILGGACNVAANIRTLSENDLIIDYYGPGSQLIVDKLSEYNINFKGIATTKDKILQKIRYTSENHHLLRMDKGLIYEKEIVLISEKLIKGFDLNQYDLIVISDYGKGIFSESLIEYLISNFSKLILIDLKKYRNWFSNLNLSNCIIKCNQKEYEDNDVKLLLHSGIQCLVQTQGKYGYTIHYGFDKDGKSKIDSFSSFKVQGNIVDVVGAGDTFLAGMAVSYLGGDDKIEQMTKFANKSAGIKVTKFGTNTILRKEIIENE